MHRATPGWKGYAVSGNGGGEWRSSFVVNAALTQVTVAFELSVSETAVATLSSRRRSMVFWPRAVQRGPSKCASGNPGRE